MSNPLQGATAQTNELLALAKASPLPFEATAIPFEVGCRFGLGVCPNTGLKEVRKGELETFTVGSRRFITGGSILAYQQRQIAKEKAKRAKAGVQS